MPETQVIEGTVLDCDETSFKLDGQGWFKYSKRAKPRHVSKGETVTVTYNTSEFEGKTYKWANKIAAAGSTPSRNGAQPEREQSIQRQSAIHFATLFVNAHATDDIENDKVEVFNLANEYLAFYNAEPEKRLPAEPQEPEEPGDPGPEDTGP